MLFLLAVYSCMAWYSVPLEMWLPSKSFHQTTYWNQTYKILSTVFEIRGNNHCGGVIFQHWFRLVMLKKSPIHSGYFLLVWTIFTTTKNPKFKNDQVNSHPNTLFWLNVIHWNHLQSPKIQTDVAEIYTRSNHGK